MEHAFNVEVANDVGIQCAVIFQHIMWWIAKNEANNQNFHDGDYWTYNSVKAYTKQFPYLSEKQIRSSLQKLIDEGYLKTANYNTSSYDRTLWYGLGDYGKRIYLNWQNHLPCRENGNSLGGEPIPVINTLTNTGEKKDISTSLRSVSISKEVSEIIDYLNLKANTSYRSSTDKTKKCINARLNEGWTIEDFKAVIDFKVKEWANTQMAMYLRPETLFGTKFEGYLQQSKTKTSVYSNPYLNRDDTFVDPDHMWD